MCSVYILIFGVLEMEGIYDIDLATFLPVHSIPPRYSHFPKKWSSRRIYFAPADTYCPTSAGSVKV